ncbi:MAG: hypothetical protein OSA06_02360 [Acidimicrobiales bacterium]|nr:hypothetical protein [Acidimicrobiales bacterium]
MVRHLTTEELEAGLVEALGSPKDAGTLDMIVRRPEINARQVVEVAELSLEEGVVGDNWSHKPTSSTSDNSPDPEAQLTLMNTRVLRLVAAGDESHMPMAGDQMVVDIDLSTANLPAGTCLQVGTAIVEVTAKPHTGCAKFVERFGAEAMRFVNSSKGRELCLRGINARVVQSGTIAKGDVVQRV